MKRLYGGLPDEPVRRDEGPVEVSPPGFRFREMEGDITQAQVGFAWRTPGALHPGHAGARPGGRAS